MLKDINQPVLLQERKLNIDTAAYEKILMLTWFTFITIMEHTAFATPLPILGFLSIGPVEKFMYNTFGEITKPFIKATLEKNNTSVLALTIFY